MTDLRPLTRRAVVRHLRRRSAMTVTLLEDAERETLERDGRWPALQPDPVALIEHRPRTPEGSLAHDNEDPITPGHEEDPS